jgi:cobalt-precorrin 5A hydrolase
MIAAGLGCRSGCAHHDVLRALDGALARAGHARDEVSALYVPEEKGAEAGLRAAAAELGKPLVLVARAALLAQSAATLTHSPQALERYGVPSVAETAALAGAAAHGRPRLLGPRQVAGAATCALAITEEASP